MPSLGDSAVIIFIGLLLFGPKGLAQIARQLGKLMGEFRRASNEFRMQMEEELRISEQAERQQQIAAIEAAAPPAPPLITSSVGDSPEDHQHLHAAASDTIVDPLPETVTEPAGETLPQTAPLPIATSGDLSIMPPATGLPAARSSSLSALINSVPHADPASAAANGTEETAVLGADVLGEDVRGADERPMRYTNNHIAEVTPPVEPSHGPAAEESVHG